MNMDEVACNVPVSLVEGGLKKAVEEKVHAVWGLEVRRR